jgi:hypothetical protein
MEEESDHEEDMGLSENLEECKQEGAGHHMLLP